jgi:hypothetical protein
LASALARVRFQRVGLGAGAVPHGRGEPGLDQIGGHRRAHDAGAEKCDVSHRTIPSCCLRSTELKDDDGRRVNAGVATAILDRLTGGLRWRDPQGINPMSTRSLLAFGESATATIPATPMATAGSSATSAGEPRMIYIVPSLAGFRAPGAIAPAYCAIAD